MKHLSKKIIIPVVATIVLVSAFVVIKPIPFTKADITITSNAPSQDPSTPTDIPVQPPAQSEPNPHIVITSNAPTDTPTPTQTVQTQQTTTPQQTGSCHQVCQNICD